MTRKQVESKIKQLMKKEKELFWKKVQKGLDSGAINLESYMDDYTLPKIIMCAVHGEMEWQYTPFDTESKKEAKNLKKCL